MENVVTLTCITLTEFQAFGNFNGKICSGYLFDYYPSKMEQNNHAKKKIIFKSN